MVIVLGFLVILSALAVAFFSSVSTELKGARTFASGVSTRQLADTAANVVMGQIRDATTRENGAWASQPGMIRVYRDSSGGVSAKAESFVKLYSSDQMTVTGSTELATFIRNPDYEKEWNRHPAFWTDLNSPVVVQNPANPAEKVPHFPIIDPRARGLVQGFNFQTASVNNAQATGTDSAPTPSDDDRLPMPVRWIYVLQDGTLSAPSSGTGAKAEWTSGDPKKPTKDNPIVGRIAFWSDDDSSKVNINTASGFVNMVDQLPADYRSDYTLYAGSYWDTPRFFTTFDFGNPNRSTGMPKPGGGGLALTQLLQGEFQRYPGHPATTSLGGIFGGFMSSEDIWRISPRVSTANYTGVAGSTVVDDYSYGTEGGIKRAVVGNPASGGGTDNQQLLPKTQRLYASVDELLYASEPGGTDPSAPSYLRKSNDEFINAATPKLTPERLDRLRFFLTATSRAPELNLFGRPRVTIWPVRNETYVESQAAITATTGTGLTAYDKATLFCSTIGPSSTVATSTYADNASALSGSKPVAPFRYIFTRRNPDLSRSKGTAITDLADVEFARNKWLLQTYLTNLTTQSIPGFGASMKAHLDSAGGQNRDQVLVEIFDYIRCANLKDTTTLQYSPSVQANKQYAPLGIIAPTKTELRGSGQPTQSGFGRFPTLSEVTLVFYYAGPTWITNPDAAAVGVRPYVVDTYKNSDGALLAGRPKYQQVRAFVLFSTFNAMQGYGPLTKPGATNYKISLEVTGLEQFTITAGGVPYPLNFPARETTTIYTASGDTWGGRNFGGYEGFEHTLEGLNTTTQKNKFMAEPTVALGAPYTTSPATNQEYYPFQTPLYAGTPYGTTFKTGIVIPTYSGTTPISTFNFNGGPVRVRVFYDQLGNANRADTVVPLQTFNLVFPPGNNWPIPVGIQPDGSTYQENPVGATPYNRDAYCNFNSAPGAYPTAANPGGMIANPNLYTCYWTDDGGFYPNAIRTIPPATGPNPPKEATQAKAYAYDLYDNTARKYVSPLKCGVEPAWSFATRLSWCMQNSYSPLRDSGQRALNWYTNRWRQIVQPGDTIRSLIYCEKMGARSTTKSGDLRIAMVSSSINEFKPHPDWDSPNSRACLLRTGSGGAYFPPGSYSGAGPQNPTSTMSAFGNHVKLTGSSRFDTGRAFGNLPLSEDGTKGVNGVIRDDGQPGDFDTGIGNFSDGPFANKQDEGNVVFSYYDTNERKWIYPIPYFGTWQYEAPGNTFTSPFRQMPSPGMLGSLPRRAADGKGWETLCFTPYPAGPGHPGNDGVVKDHLLLDLFTMPVVEPYPISEPFSTAGKINMNCRIAPFDYIKRETALLAALAPVRVTAVTKSKYNTYKKDATNYDKPGGEPDSENFRKVIDCNDPTKGPMYSQSETMKAFEAFFDKGNTDADAGLFKSASQICEMALYPIGESGIDTFWNTKGELTGDNMREKPYTDLYPRLTTKSNTYTVHYRVQTLRQVPRDVTTNTNAYAVWEEGKDNILGEARGATTIERYIDPSDRRFISTNSETIAAGDFINPDATVYDSSKPETRSLELAYRFRTVGNKKFAP